MIYMIDSYIFSSFIIQKKKAIRVTEPTCTFDSINDRYFPYTMIREDGSYIDTV